MGFQRSYRGRKGMRRARGFTLIEVICATVLLTTGLMSAFYMVGLGTSVNADAKNMALAYQVAQQEIEILRNIPWEPSGTFGGLGSLYLPAFSSPDSAGCYERRFLQPIGVYDASRPGDVNYNGRTYPGLVPALSQLPNGRGGLVITNPTTGLYKNVTVVVRWTDPGNRERVIAVATSIAKGGIDPR